MREIVDNPNAIIGSRPVNLSEAIRPEWRDGSIACQLHHDGFYAGIIAVKAGLDEFFKDQPEVLEQLQTFFVEEDSEQ